MGGVTGISEEVVFYSILYAIFHSNGAQTSFSMYQHLLIPQRDLKVFGNPPAGILQHL